MLKISSKEFQRNLGLYQEQAHRESITITRHSRDYLVLMDVEEYKRLRRSARIALSVNHLSDDDIALIESSTMSSKYDYLNAELDGNEK